MSNLPLPVLSKRNPYSHKGHFGHAFLVGGSTGMTGAVTLAGRAALRSGAGLVTLGTTKSCQSTVAGCCSCYMTLGLPSDADGRLSLSSLNTISEFANKSTCVALGPGLGQSDELDALVNSLYCDLPIPVVVDADALNALGRRPDPVAGAGPRILTPHPGEFRRLTGSKPTTAEESQKQAAELAKESGAVVVLKGHRTVVADGQQCYENTTGNPGMATGGSGDVLTGIITALVCQGLDAFEAAQLGVYIHGLAGDIAANRWGEVSMIARDLIECLPEAFQTYQSNLK